MADINKKPDTLEEILDKICANVFGYRNPFTPEQFLQKFGFDIRLPKPINDSTDGSQTWAQSTNPTKFITFKNAQKRAEIDDFMIPKRPINSVEDILAAWQETNYMATERQLESIDIFESDNIYNSQNVYRSMDVHFSKNVFACDGCHKFEYVACSQRSNSSTYCLRIEDSKECSNSFNIIWSGKITNCLFINDCYDMYKCMFCSHMAGKKFCIANMQFTEEEYNHWEKIIKQWILSN
ncbi:hypothetical protein KC960_00720 [Candidatus Saccharibacteria bacterium]|nr:hypothetical protein [Candidatus Saccharibacteria bacterium]